MTGIANNKYPVQSLAFTAASLRFKQYPMFAHYSLRSAIPATTPSLSTWQHSPPVTAALAPRVPAMRGGNLLYTLLAALSVRRQAPVRPVLKSAAICHPCSYTGFTPLQTLQRQNVHRRCSDTSRASRQNPTVAAEFAAITCQARNYKRRFRDDRNRLLYFAFSF